MASPLVGAPSTKFVTVEDYDDETKRDLKKVTRGKKIEPKMRTYYLFKIKWVVEKSGDILPKKEE